MTDRLKVGVVGAGVIAQVMHLNYLRELSDRFESLHSATSRRRTLRTTQSVTASRRHSPTGGKCSKKPSRRRLHPDLGKSCAHRDRRGEGGQARPGGEADVLLGGRGRGDEDRRRRGGSDADGRVPQALRPGIRTVPSGRGERRRAAAHAGHHLRGAVPCPTSATTRWRRSRRSRRMRSRPSPRKPQASITRAIGEADPFLREEYHLVLLDTLVHELNTVRGVLGEPTSLEYVDMQSGQLTVILKFGELSVAIHWMDLPGITRYGMEFALYGPQQRVTLTFPSPFLRSAPANVEIVEGDEVRPSRAASTRSSRTRAPSSWNSRHSIDCVTTGEPPPPAPKTPFTTSRCARRSFDSSRTPGRFADPSAIPALTSAN